MRKPLHPIALLIIKHLEGRATPQEQAELNAEVSASAGNRALLEELTDEYRMSRDLSAYSADKKATWAKIVALAPELQEKQPLEKPVKRTRWIYHYSIAVMILLAVGISSWHFYLGDQRSNGVVQLDQVHYKNDVDAPASHCATLTLADGTVINLDEVPTGQLAGQDIMEVVKREDGAVEYRESGIVNRQSSIVNRQSSITNRRSGVTYNTISTPTGGRHKIVLADGSVVWLNAASSLRYPTRFTGNKRVVALTGEGYFEVEKQAAPGKRPFIVKVKGMQVEVLGTHFTINSYTDEPAIRTTLLEGSVKVLKGGQSVVLQPGQQAAVSPQSPTSLPIPVQTVDTEAAIAWKNDLFIYNNAPITTIMGELVRHYNVEVVYAGNLPADKFNIMGIPQHVPISRILKTLELTGKVRFEVEGRRITVRKG
jgi:transmembrane sensor